MAQYDSLGTETLLEINTDLVIRILWKNFRANFNALLKLSSPT